MQNRTTLIVDHYQKTFELTFDVWRQRNKVSLLLLAVIGAATLLTFEIPEANSLLVDFLAKVLNVTDQSRIKELRTSFPYGILQSILLFAVFYLMVNLYHRTVWVLRNYRYLGALETEIRDHLNLQEATVAFSREGDFYWRNRCKGLGSVKWVYIVLLAGLLSFFLIGKFYNDLSTGSLILIVIDLVMGSATLFFYIAYILSSVRSG